MVHFILSLDNIGFVPYFLQDRWHGIIQNKLKKFRPKHDKDKDDVKAQIAARQARLKREADELDGRPEKKAKIDSWGFINFNPKQPAGEDDDSIAAHKQWLKVDKKMLFFLLICNKGTIIPYSA